MRKKISILLCMTILLGGLNISTVYADSDDYNYWTWSNPTDLSVQYFTSALDYDYEISGGANAWNNVAPSSVMISSIEYNINNNDNGCDIRIYGQELTGTTMATTGIYTKTLWWWTQQTNTTYTGVVDPLIK